jgi:hypothetical protein
MESYQNGRKAVLFLGEEEHWYSCPKVITPFSIMNILFKKKLILHIAVYCQKKGLHDSMAD